MAHKELIDHYEHGGEKLALAIRGLTREDLLAVPDPGANVGRITVESYLRAATDHLEHHVKFIHDKRAHMGKEIW